MVEQTVACTYIFIMRSLVHKQHTTAAPERYIIIM